MKVSDLFKLKGKVALVTGGGRGIGKFIATGLAEAGADLIISSRKMKNLEATAREIEKECGVKVFPVECDIAKEAAIDNLLKSAAEKFPRIDILVNNAGVSWGAPTLEFPLEKWDYVFNTNIRGLWILTQKVARIMNGQGGGNIINISSIMGFRGSLESHPAVPYNSTKGAVNLLTMNLAVKLAPYNIRVNAIGPGATDTAMYRGNSPAEVVEARLRRHPLEGGAGKPQDIVGTALFFVTEASSYVTGQIFYMKDPHAS